MRFSSGIIAISNMSHSTALLQFLEEDDMSFNGKNDPTFTRRLNLFIFSSCSGFR